MTPQMFAQVALTLKKLGDIDRKLQLEKYFYKLPEQRKVFYINVLSEHAASNRNTLLSFFDFVKFPLAFQLRDSLPETHEVLLESVVKLSHRYDDAEFLEEALDVLWNWSLPDILLDRAYSDLLAPYLSHPDERIRIAAIQRIGRVVRRGGALNSPKNIVQLIEGIWEDEASSTRMRASAIFALNGLTAYDRDTGSHVSKMISAALRSEVSEFRHEAVLLIAREQSWKIAHEWRQDAFHSLLRILKEERDMDSFLLTAFDRVPGEIPEWARRELAERRDEQRKSDQMMRTLDSGRPSKRPKKETEYDIAISFAGEDRNLAETLAQMLILRGVTVFYDDFEKADLWGKDLFQHLQSVYRDSARPSVPISMRHLPRP